MLTDGDILSGAQNDIVDVLQKQDDPITPAGELGRWNIIVGKGQNVINARQMDAESTATCDFPAATADQATQTCDVTQSGDGPNTITANLRANATDGTAGAPVSLPAVEHKSNLILRADQTAETFDNTVTVTEAINQRANSVVAANTLVTHQQDTFELANVKQLATGTNASNHATITLNRLQDSSATGASPEEFQDTLTVEGDGKPTVCQDNAYALANGNACVYQRAMGTSGKNDLKVRAMDKKVENAVALTGAEATQTQGQDGQYEWLGLANVKSPNNLTGSTIDMGDPSGAPQPTSWNPGEAQPNGVFKDWSLEAHDFFGGDIGGDSDQFDQIGLPAGLGKSPCSGTLNSGSRVLGEKDTFQHVRLIDLGHADCPNGWKYKQTAHLKTPEEEKNGGAEDLTGTQNMDSTVDCTQNEPNQCVNSGLAASGVNVSGTEGKQLTAVAVAAFTDKAPNANDTATIDWGDETPSSAGTVSGCSNGTCTVLGTHTYKDEGSYTITTTVSNPANGTVAVATSTATIADAPLHGTGRALFVGPDKKIPANTLVATFTDENPYATVEGDFTPSPEHPNAGASINWGDGTTAGNVTKNAEGVFEVRSPADHVYAGSVPSSITVTLNDEGGSTASAVTTLTTYGCAVGGCFVIGANSTTGTVTWWANDWSTKNPLKPPAPSSFKGFENLLIGTNAPSDASKPPCPPTTVKWSTGGGNSPPPPSGIPAHMLVIVTSSASKSGSAVTGTIVKLVVVDTTNSGYSQSPSPGSSATGTVEYTVCG
jgi:hypothetical protein